MSLNHSQHTDGADCKRPSLTARLLDLFFPPKCPFCRRLLAAKQGLICDTCQTSLPWLAGGAAEQKLEFVSLCISPLRYQGEVREAIHRYKFQGLTAYAAPFGTLIAQCTADHLDGAFDLISWVPLSKARLRKRGYDQARILAEVVARAQGATALPVLRKPHNTATQSTISDDSQRRANVMGAYELHPDAQVAGMRILLIDDVVTSGATLSECARILRTAGAAGVVCATLARAK